MMGPAHDRAARSEGQCKTDGTSSDPYRSCSDYDLGVCVRCIDMDPPLTEVPPFENKEVTYVCVAARGWGRAGPSGACSAGGC